MGLLILFLTLAIAVSFLCSILEAVILSVSVSFIRLKEMEGKASVKYLKRLKNNIDQPLSAILSINTVAHTIGAAGVGAQAVAVFGEVYFGIISAILTLLILIFSEIIPKTIGAIYWRSLALISARIIIGMIYISFPLVILSKFITRVISRNMKPPTMSREELIAFAQIGTKKGVLEESESKIITNLIRLRTINVRSIMTPRTVVVAAPEDMQVNEFIKQKEYLQYSRIPVYSGTIDNITGYILNSDVLEKLANKNINQELNDIKRPIIIFYENFSIPSLFERLLLKKEHIAVIISEYGGMEGLVTMEDIIETILGLEIMDEKDSEVDMQELARKIWEIRKKNLWTD
ncbi:MAG: hemolysin family protein [Bacteroidales bacterium]|nr:hemolysin family protein [Bacteroidales bacterium]